MTSKLNDGLAEFDPNDLVQNKRFCGSLGAPKEGAVYVDCVFDQVTWNDVQIRRVVFQRCAFLENKFEAVELADCVFEDCKLDGDHLFIECNLRDCYFSTLKAGQVVFSESILFSVNFNACDGSVLTFLKSRLGMNVFSNSSWESVKYIQSEVVDEGFSDVKMNFLGWEDSKVVRQISGNVSIANLHVKSSTGEMIRYFKSNIGAMELFSCVFSQYAVAHSSVDDMKLTDCVMSLSEFSSSKLSSLYFSNSRIEKPLFDECEVETFGMSLAKVSGGSLRQANIKDWTVRRSSLDSIDARGLSIGDTDFQGFHVESSNFAGQNRNAWSGVTFKDTNFEERMSVEEKHWWHAFKRGSDAVIL